MHYVRSRFLWTWLAIGCLALLTGFALVLATQTAETNLKQTDDIARLAKQTSTQADTTATAAKEQSDQTVAYLRGEQGIPGVPGSNGVDGTPGQLSSVAGPPGPKGADGEAGSPGTPGTTGTAGPVGPSGAFGAIGPVGPTGNTGPPGENGSNGAKGEKGDPGEDGTAGAAGAAGPAGAQGPPGPAGPTGPPGAGSNVTVNSSTTAAATPSDTTAIKNLTATCPNGRISGGGFAVIPNDPGIIVTASTPVGVTGWQATATVLLTSCWYELAVVRVRCLCPDGDRLKGIG